MLGLINVYKPRGLTSFNIVGKIKKIYGTKQVGHLGTLDPMAEGVLMVAVGKATKLFDYFLNKDKEYIGTFKSNEETDTLDAEGEVINTTQNIVSIEELDKTLKNFIGNISQTPPKFSAIKINGRRAYDLARKGVDFDIKPKQVSIYSLERIMEQVNNLYTFKIHCSAGTYIRSLGRDIFYSINNLCTMVKLVRTRCGKFDISNAKTIEEIEKDPNTAIIKIEDAVNELNIKTINEEFFTKIKNGVQIRVNKKDFPSGQFLLKVGTILMGIAEVKNDKLVLKVNLYEGE